MSLILKISLAVGLIGGAAGNALAQEQARPRDRVAELRCALAGICDNEENGGENSVETIRGFDREDDVGIPRGAAPRVAPVRPATVRPVAVRAVSPARRRPVANAVPRRAAAALRHAPVPARCGTAGSRRADLELVFDSGSAALTETAQQDVRSLAQTVRTTRGLDGMRVCIEGHTDNVGGRAYNMDLSRRRAQAVVAYLGELGLAPGRLDARGFGYDHPRYNPASEPGNRRVEVVVEARR